MNEHCSLFKHRSLPKLSLLILALVSISSGVKSQNILNSYILQGLESNDNIKQQQFALHKSLHALKEARSLFYPSVSLMADYTRADGGRTVDLPVGDILNPVYATLNELTGTQNFPKIENQKVLLNPNDFYDAKIRTVLPLVNMELLYNKKIKKHQVNLQQLELDIFKRELVKEIKVSYFKYLQSASAVSIYASTLDLVKENLRINQTLFKNNQANRTAVVRSESEVIKYQTQLEVARLEQKSAGAYFNFLLNKDLSAEILIDAEFKELPAAIVQDTSVSQREELKKIDIANKINRNLIGLSRSFIVPQLNTYLDMGSQGFDWKYNSNTQYYLFGVSLKWDLFSSGKNFHKIEQAKLDGKILQSEATDVENQLKVQLKVKVNEYQSSVVQYLSAKKQQQFAEKNYTDIQKQYKEGKALLIELMDAQNLYVTSMLQSNILLFESLAKWAEVERANASFAIN